MSVASYWEVTVKIQKGQLGIRDVANWWTRAGKDLRADVLSIRASHVAELAKLPEHHKDPFDRILISQALAEGLAMITIDDAIRKYPVKAIW